MDAAIAELRNRGVLAGRAVDRSTTPRRAIGSTSATDFAATARTDQFTAGAGTGNAATVAIVRFVLPLT